MEWEKPEEEMPQDQHRVVCIVKNEFGNTRIVIAEHISARTTLEEDYLSNDWDNEGLTEYDEENDCYWVMPNWFESNLYDEINYKINDPILAWVKVEIPEEYEKIVAQNNVVGELQ